MGESRGELVTAVAALLVMAIAAALETSASLISRHRLRELAEQQNRQRTLLTLLDSRRSLIASLLTVQAVAIATAASLMTTVVGRELKTAEHLLAVIVVAGAYLLLGQALPRALASSRPEQIALWLVGLAGLLVFLVRPLVALVDGIVRVLMAILPGAQRATPAGTEEELRAVVLEDGEHEVIEAAEREMIDNVLQLEETTARDIMVPRVDIVAIEESTPLRDIVATITRAGHSRLPVYRDSIDQIVGVLYAKDLLPFVVGTTKRPPLAMMLRPAHIVPESKRIDDLLTELRRKRIHIAIVADEYGGTAGLVTIEDILEEIVGEIQDEYDTGPLLLLERVSDEEVLADGRVPIGDIAELLGIDLGDEAGGTAAGFVHEHLGRLPEVGEEVDAIGLHVEVVAVEGHRLRRLRVTRMINHTGGGTISRVSDVEGARSTTSRGDAGSPATNGAAW